MQPKMVDIVLSLLGSAAFLAVAVLAWRRGRTKSVEAVAWPFALLCLDLFAYNLLQAITDSTEQPVWRWLTAVSASVVAPFFYHLVLAFVGQRRALGRLLFVCYAYFVALAFFCLAPFFVEGNAFPGGDQWSLLMLVGEVPVLAHSVWLLSRNLVGTSEAERARTRLVLAAGLIAGLATAIELATLASGRTTTHLAVPGLLIGALLLGAAALRVLEGLTFLSWVNAAAIGLIVVLAEVTVFSVLGQRTALVVVATVLVVLAAAAAMRFVVADYASYRERTLAHVSLGRMAAQMAHDIKNPLASIRGATQFLAGERAAGRSVDGQGEFFELLVQQCDRLARIVDQYHRIGRAEPQLAPASLNDVVKEATKFLNGAATLDTQLAEPLPGCSADHDLIVIALENVLRNAHEAAVGKTVHVQTGAAAEWVFVAVRDEGPGMDPRTKERALDGFFTTKTQGSGLGLAFVRRVVEAHKGKLTIDSAEGKGTTVRIELRAAG